MPDCDVLIAGAGPTGLVLALWLTRLGARVRIIDKDAEPGKTSRAVAVQARTLEEYRQIGLASHVVEHGHVVLAANFWVGGKRQAHVEFGAMGKGLSPFPYMLIFPQEEHEQLLIDRLAEIGVTVERQTALTGFENGSAGVEARLQTLSGSGSCHAAYLAGCDGARSTVRETLRLGYPGGTYNRLFYVADVEASGPVMNGELNVALDESDFLACFPLKHQGHVRLIGAVRQEAPENNKEDSKTLGWSDVNHHAIEHLQLTVKNVSWFSTYRVHHRVASAFRVGNAFLLGDAAHIHSPVGGQGMNTGIGDAVNLAWKLAAVLQGKARPEILESYAQERVPFARRLVETTDRVFEFASSDGPLATQVRTHLAGPFFAAVFHLPMLPRFMFNTASQIRINYRDSMLSEGQAGRVRGGDRLPWVPQAGGGDNFDPLSSMAWQVHIYGDPRQDVQQECAVRGLPLHAFAWDTNAKTAGLEQDAAYLIRPDGYVALAADSADTSRELTRYLEAHGIRAGS